MSHGHIDSASDPAHSPNGAPASPVEFAPVLDRALNSSVLSRSDQLKKLLAYIGQHTSAGEASRITESEIATHVFHRVNFDPRLDTIVRSQMLRLRKKLDEYYATEGRAEPWRISIAKSSYHPVLAPNLPDSGDQAVRQHHRAGMYFFIGLGAGMLLASILGWALLSRAPSSPLSGELLRSPLWLGFGRREVTLAHGSFLFFRHDQGMNRDFRLNLPQDMPLAPKFLPIWPASPLWDQWASSEDIGAAVTLARTMIQIGSKVAVLPARDLSVGSLNGRAVIILGHPRSAPILFDVLAKLPFRVLLPEPGKQPLGFVNTAPRTGEQPIYSPNEIRNMGFSDQNTPDYALLTRIRNAGGSELLSVFGNRNSTSGYVLEQALDQGLLAQLNAQVFQTGVPYSMAQVVLRVDFHRGSPTGAVPLAWRVQP